MFKAFMIVAATLVVGALGTMLTQEAINAVTKEIRRM
jgi:hypothetical protein